MATLVPPQLHESWKIALKEEFSKPYLLQLGAFLAEERASGTPIYPPKTEVFQAFEKTPFDQVKVVIVGQDPYHGKGQAHGLCFSVKKGVPPPPSLKNIFKELQDDLAIPPPTHGCLSAWAEQGVLMLNTVLTVREGSPGSHRGKGWEKFTDSALQKLAALPVPPIFVLWGKDAQEKCRAILTKGHVLASAHPSPFSAHNGFFGSHPFSKINNILKTQGKRPINWSIP